MMMALLAQASDRSPLKGLLGSFHPGIVHFPIALLSVAALFEVVQWVRRRREPSAATPALAYLAAAAAIPASIFGFMLADYGGEEGRLLSLHKWLGVASTAVAVAAAGCALKARTCPGSLLGLRISLILGTVLVLGTGYLGGELVFGENHILKFLRQICGCQPDHSQPPSVPTNLPEPKGDHEPPAGAKVDFLKDVMPILRDNCWKCHGGEKIKGKFNLTSRKSAVETPAESGKAILPGKPSISKFYTSLLDSDPDSVMPPLKEKKRPTKDEIEILRKWVEQGAPWPESFEFKK